MAKVERRTVRNRKRSPHPVRPSLRLRPSRAGPYHLGREIWKWGELMKTLARVHLSQRNGVGWEYPVTYITRRVVPYLISSNTPYAWLRDHRIPRRRLDRPSELCTSPGTPGRKGQVTLALGARETVQCWVSTRNDNKDQMIVQHDRQKTRVPNGFPSPIGNFKYPGQERKLDPDRYLGLKQYKSR